MYQLDKHVKLIKYACNSFFIEFTTGCLYIYNTVYNNFLFSCSKYFASNSNQVVKASVITNIGLDHTKFLGNTLGAPFKPMAISKKMMPNKISFEMKANMGGQTMSLMKRNFSGKKGYMEQQGQKMAMDDKEIEEAMSVEGIFDELYFTS